MKKFYLWPRWFWRFPSPLFVSGYLEERKPYKVGFAWLWWYKGETE